MIINNHKKQLFPMVERHARIPLIPTHDGLVVYVVEYQCKRCNMLYEIVDGEGEQLKFEEGK